jgi:hypothetical protein
LPLPTWAATTELSDVLEPLPPTAAGAVTDAVPWAVWACADEVVLLLLTWAVPTDRVALLLPPTWTVPPDCEALLPPLSPTVAAVVPVTSVAPVAPATGVSATTGVGSTVAGPTWTVPTDWLAEFPSVAGGAGLPGSGSGLCACAAPAARAKVAAPMARIRNLREPCFCVILNPSCGICWVVPAFRTTWRERRGAGPRCHLFE